MSRQIIYRRIFCPLTGLNLSKEAQSLHLSVSKERLISKDKSTLHIRNGDVLTILLLGVVKYLVLGVFLGTVFIDEHILAILPN